MTDHDKKPARRLLITGATGGMGRSSALLAASKGYDLVLADLSVETLRELAAECTRHGVVVTCQVLDVTRAASIAALTAALQSCGGVDGIIHTVGLSPQMAASMRIIDVDLLGTVALLEQSRPYLNAGGCALCIASMSAYMVPANADIELALTDALSGDASRLLGLTVAGGALEHPGMAYAYAKKALKQYVVDYAAAWGTEGKRFVSLSPGLIDTAMGRLEENAMDNFAEMRSRVALGRLGAPEDIANTALFLVSANAAYITGCDILVDGGFVASLNARRAPTATP
jgi:NAD(P)-dependent dehydrogenase (short-subunit alcohol dehydrogenase family)